MDLKKSLLPLFALLFAYGLTANKPANAQVPIEFASFSGVPLTYVDDGAASGFTSVPEAVGGFSFDHVTTSFGAGGTPINDVYLTVSVQTNGPVQSFAGNDYQPFSSLDFDFTQGAGVSATQLLSVDIGGPYVAVYGQPAGIGLLTQGDTNVTGTTFSFASPYLNFTGTSPANVTFDLNLQSGNVSTDVNGYLNSFTAVSNGEFAVYPMPTGVPAAPAPEISPAVSFAIATLFLAVIMFYRKKTAASVS